MSYSDFKCSSDVKATLEIARPHDFSIGRGKWGVSYEIEAYMGEELLWSKKTDNLIPTIGAEQILIDLMPASGETSITAWFISLIAATSNQQSTGSMTASSADLTLATAFGTEGVVGQVITVVGAGVSGANLVTTISSITSTTAYVLAATASTAVTNAVCVLGPVMAVGDTSASHAGWVEVTTSQVTQTTRQSFTPGTVSTSGSNAIKTNSASPAVYTGNTPTWWMTGIIMASTDVFGSTTDTLLSEAAFDANASPPGAAMIQNGMTLNIKATFTSVAG